MDEATLHRRALAETDDERSLGLWVELATLGNPEAPDRLRVFARCDDPVFRDPARAALLEMGLSHETPMP